MHYFLDTRMESCEKAPKGALALSPKVMLFQAFMAFSFFSICPNSFILGNKKNVRQLEIFLKQGLTRPLLAKKKAGLGAWSLNHQLGSKDNMSIILEFAGIFIHQERCKLGESFHELEVERWEQVKWVQVWDKHRVHRKKWPLLGIDGGQLRPQACWCLARVTCRNSHLEINLEVQQGMKGM